MRVIAGQYRSRKLISVPGLSVRPTPDRLRESLFSILAPALQDKIFADVYAGSGSVGIEAISRGAKRVHFVEKNREALEVLRTNIQSLGAQSQANVIRRPAAAALLEMQADIVFLDPPFDRPSEFDEALASLAKNPAPLVIVQHPPRQKLAESYGPLALFRTVKQGDNWLSFFRPASTSDDVAEVSAAAEPAEPTSL